MTAEVSIAVVMPCDPALELLSNAVALAGNSRCAGRRALFCRLGPGAEPQHGQHHGQDHEYSALDTQQPALETGLEEWIVEHPLQEGDSAGNRRVLPGLQEAGPLAVD